jgi:hypothetical protein
VHIGLTKKNGNWRNNVEIESIQVIPMRKDSIWEDVKNYFDVSYITTSFAEWKVHVLEKEALVKSENIQLNTHSKFTKDCFEFASKHKAFMLASTGLFGDSLYMAITSRTDSLEGFVVDGPLYMVTEALIDDIKSGKILENQSYTDPITFMPMVGLWYAKKKTYIIRYGKKQQTYR